MDWMSCVASNEHGNMSINVSYGELIVFEFELEFLDLLLMLENFNIINMNYMLNCLFVCELILDWIDRNKKNVRRLLTYLLTYSPIITSYAIK